MTTIKQCPCGKTPTTFGVNLTQGTKWAEASPDCCGEWLFEFRTHYERDQDKLLSMAVREWNLLPRFWEPPTGQPGEGER